MATVVGIFTITHGIFKVSFALVKTSSRGGLCLGSLGDTAEFINYPICCCATQGARASMATVNGIFTIAQGICKVLFSLAKLHSHKFSGYICLCFRDNAAKNVSNSNYYNQVKEQRHVHPMFLSIQLSNIFQP
jgi:hypothetical protein